MSTAAQVIQPNMGLFRENLAEWVRERLGDATFVAAKESFCRRNGVVFPDDSFFEQRMNYFLDIFLFEDRSLECPDGSAVQTPYESFYWQHTAGDAGQIVVDAYRHSLFVVKTAARSSLVLDDALTSTRHLVTADSGEWFAGVRRNDLIQGFLFIKGGVTVMSRGLLFHPRDVRRVVFGHLAKSKLDPHFDEKSWLSRLARQQVRHLRHAHVHPSLIYGIDPP